MLVPYGAFPGSNWAEPGTVDNEVETRTERVRHHLSKTAGQTRKTTEMKTGSHTVKEIVPIRNTLRYASKKDWDELKQDVKPIYTAPSLQAAEQARDAMYDKWGDKYPAIQRLWENAWEQFTAFLQYNAQIRTVIFY
jgi:hypothetical protein